MTPIHPAPLQLADLARVMRPDWDRTELESAVDAARRFGGWPWERVCGEVFRLLLQQDSSPHDLTVAARKPVGQQQADPEMTKQWAADCRKFLKVRKAS